MASIFDILNPSQERGPFQTGVQSISDIFAANLPNVIGADVGEDISGGQAFVAGLLSGLGEPARQREARREQRRQEVRQVALKLLPALSRSSQERAIQALTGAEDLELPTPQQPFLTPEEAAQLEFMGGVLNSIDAPEGRAELIKQMAPIVGLDFDEEMIEKMSQAKPDLSSEVDKMALDILKQMQEENLGVEDIPGSQKAVLMMANPQAFATRGAFDPRDLLTMMEVQLMESFFNKLRLGEEPTATEKAIAKQRGFIEDPKKPIGNLLDEANAYQKMAESAALSGDLEMEARFLKQAEETLNKIDLINESNLMQGIPPSDPAHQFRLFMNEHAQNPFAPVPKTMNQLNQLLDEFFPGLSEAPELEQYKEQFLRGEFPGQRTMDLSAEIQTMSEEQMRMLESELQSFVNRTGETPTPEQVKELIKNVKSGRLSETGKAVRNLISTVGQELPRGAQQGQRLIGRELEAAAGLGQKLQSIFRRGE